MERDMATEFYIILDKIMKIKFSKHFHEKIHNSEGLMLYRIHDYYESEEAKKGAGLTAGKLANALCMSRSAVSKTLNVLEEKDLAERYVYKGDRRFVYIRLTDAGFDYVLKRKQATELFSKKMISKLGRDELESLVKVLNHLYEIMKEEAERYGID